VAATCYLPLDASIVRAGLVAVDSVHAWATRWQIPAACLAELLAIMGVSPVPPAADAQGSEAGVQAAVRLEAARRGALLWRNNCGATQDERGNYIRYGLCNESKQVNAVCKSSDLIGIGSDGRFWAIETKAPGWKYRESDARAKAQLAFIKLVLARGGVAKFVTGVEEL
jgi:hypothetical protein